MVSRIIFLFFLFAVPTFAQVNDDKVFVLENTYNILMADTGNRVLQQNYVFDFPADAKSFIAFFQTQGDDKAISGTNNYLGELARCANKFPTQVMYKCIDIGKELEWKDKSVLQLKRVTFELAIKFVKVFTNKFKLLEKKEQEKLLAFYADVDSLEQFPEYQKLIDRLNYIGDKEMAQRIIDARSKALIKKEKEKEKENKK